MKRVVPVAVIAVLGLAAAPAVRAQDDDAPVPRVQDDADDRADDGQVHGEGIYGGVNPTDPAANKVTHKDAAAKNTLHWIGFQQETSSTAVFLQAAQPFTVDQHVEGGALVVSISGLARLGKNVRRPLDTRYFDGPVTRITARARKPHGARRGHPKASAGIDVTIAFRDGKPSTAELRTATEADGMFYAYLTLPGGSGANTGTGRITIPPSEPSAPATQPSATQPSNP